jgi:hypothetical protein
MVPSAKDKVSKMQQRPSADISADNEWLRRKHKEGARRHNKTEGVVRRPIEQYVEGRLLSKISDSRVIRDKDLSEEVRSLRADLNFATGTVGSRHTVPIDISCPDGSISS